VRGVRRFPLLSGIQIIAGFARSRVEMALNDRWKFCRGLRSRGACAGLHERRPGKLCRVLGRHPNPSNLQFTAKLADSCHTTRHSPAG
jgi:hypothetical protein